MSKYPFDRFLIVIIAQPSWIDLYYSFLCSIMTYVKNIKISTRVAIEIGRKDFFSVERILVQHKGYTFTHICREAESKGKDLS